MATATTTRVKKKRSPAEEEKAVVKKTTTSRTRTKTNKTGPAKTTKATGAKSTAKTKAAPKTTAKKTTKKAPVVVATEPRVVEYTPEGFVAGSDSALIAKALVEGGIDRNEVNQNAIDAIAASSGLLTKNGKEKYVPSMVSSILSKMVNTGEFQVVASWQLVPVEA